MVLPASVDLIELRYEGGKSEPGDDVSRVTLSKVHKAAQLVLSEDRLTVTGECTAQFVGFVSICYRASLLATSLTGQTLNHHS